MKTQSKYFQESENLAEEIELQKKIAEMQLKEFQELSFTQKRKAIEWANEYLNRPIYQSLKGTVSKKLRIIFDSLAKENEVNAYMSVTGTVNLFFNNCL